MTAVERLEYELLDTWAFADDRYFDVVVEYAKKGPEDLLIRITVHNRGPEAARLHLLPTLWFRNTWAWGGTAVRPTLRELGGAVVATHPELGEYTLACDGNPELLFTDNETNLLRLWGEANSIPYVKDAFHRYVVGGDEAAVNSARTGTKAAARSILEVPAGSSRTARLRLAARRAGEPFAGDFDATFAARLADCDEFYERITPRAPELVAQPGAPQRRLLSGLGHRAEVQQGRVDAGVGTNRRPRSGRRFGEHPAGRRRQSEHQRRWRSRRELERWRRGAVRGQPLRRIAQLRRGQRQWRHQRRRAAELNTGSSSRGGAYSGMSSGSRASSYGSRGSASRGGGMSRGGGGGRR